MRDPLYPKHSPITLKVFDSVYVNMVDAGESSGTLDVVLQRLAEFQEARLKLGNKSKVR